MVCVGVYLHPAVTHCSQRYNCNCQDCMPGAPKQACMARHINPVITPELPDQARQFLWFNPWVVFLTLLTSVSYLRVLGVFSVVFGPLLRVFLDDYISICTNILLLLGFQRLGLILALSDFVRTVSFKKIVLKILQYWIRVYNSSLFLISLSTNTDISVF